MEQLQRLAQHAWQHHIISSSLKRNSLLKPLDMLLTQLEAEPKPDMRAAVRAALVEDIFGHLTRIAPAARKPGRAKYVAVEGYVDLFFDGVLDGAHRGDVNRLLGRSKLLRSAYLFYLRECIPAKRQDASLSDDTVDVLTGEDDEGAGEPAWREEER